MATSSKTIFLNGLGWNGLATVVNRVLPSALTIVLAWMLTPSELGDVSFILSSYTVLSFFADWGIAYAFQSFVPEIPSQIGRVFWTGLVIRAGASLVLSMACLVLDLWLGILRGYGWYVFVVLMCSVLGSGVFVLNAQLRFREISLLSVLHSVIYFSLSIFLVLGGMRIDGPIYALALAFLMMGIVFFLRAPELLASAAFDRQVGGRLLRFGTWATVATGLTALTTQAGVLMLPYLSNASETGVYKVALTMGMVPSLLGNAIVLPLLPVCRRTITNNPAEAAELIQIVIRYLLLGSLLAVGIGFVLSSCLVEILVSAAYQAAAGPFRVLLVANLLGMIYTVLSSVAFVGEGLRRLSSISLKVATAVLFGNLLSIHFWGSTGAAVVMLLAYCIGLALIIKWLQKRLQIELEWRRYLVYCLAALEASIVLLIFSILVASPALQLGLGIILAIGSYGAALIVHKGIKMSEMVALTKIAIGRY